MYLADKTGRFLPTDTAKKYEVLQWLMIQLTGVGPMFGQWTHFKMFAPKGSSDYSMGRYTSELKRLYALLEERLGVEPYSSAATSIRSPTSRPFRGRATTTPRA